MAKSTSTNRTKEMRKVSMTDETPEFICRGCGYKEENCVCPMQKTLATKPIQGIVLMAGGVAKAAMA